MFGVDWSNSETLWLNLTNLGLGLIVLACLAVVTRALLSDLRERSKFRLRVSGMDREVKDLLSGHVMPTPELGLLMADGGEPVEEEGKAPRKKSAPKGGSAQKP